MGDTVTLPKSARPDALAISRPRLRVVYSPTAGSQPRRVFSLPLGDTWVGRTLPSDRDGIALAGDPALSAVHAHLQVSPADYRVKIADCDSKNGTWAGGKRCGRDAQPLSDGDMLRLGGTFLVLRYERAQTPDAEVPGLGGISPSIRALRVQLQRLATEPQPLLLHGATGTGKEVVARALHRLSQRPGELVQVNCAAIAPSLAESELFGHVERAFTDAKPRPAVQQRPAFWFGMLFAFIWPLRRSEMRIGDYVGGYRLMRLLAQGGMGVVYEALNEPLNRRVAVKLIHPALARDREQCTRFFNEARVVNLIRHPGLVGIHEHGQLPDGNAYIVMEYLDGQTLSQRLRSGGDERLPVSQVIRIARQVAAALVAVHAQNVVHRDLKPDNLMLIDDPEVAGGERVKILDFGIAKVGAQHVGLELSGATKKGNWLGTPGYMAPEQIYGAHSVDGRADVYSLGVILYELLVGHRPFYCGSLEQEMRSNMTAVPPPLLEQAPATPLPLAGLVHSMLAKEAEARPRMPEVVELLHAIEGSTPGAVAVGQAAPRSVAWPSFPGVALAVFLLAGILLFAGAYSGTGAGPGSAASGPQPFPARLDAGIVDLASPPAPPERPRIEPSEAPSTGVVDLATPSKPTQSKRGPKRGPAAGKELNPDEIYNLPP